MNLREILQPYETKNVFDKSTLGFSIQNWNRKELPENTIFLVGVSNYIGKTDVVNEVRTNLYNLSTPPNLASIIDLGNLISLSYKDQKETLKTLIQAIKKKNSVGIIFYEKDICFEPYYDNLPIDPIQKLVSVDNKIDENFIALNLHAQIKKAIHFVGIQSYFVSASLLKTHQNFTAFHLGEIRDNIKEAEPEIRMAETAFFNANAVRTSDYPANSEQTPNGLFAEEMCQLAWFAGNNNNLNTIVIWGINSQVVSSKQSVQLLAQTIWYFIMGASHRTNTNPSINSNAFKQYHIKNNRLPEDLVMYKNIKSGKFWFNYGKSNSFVPCSAEDMEIVLRNDIPERIIKFIRKL